MLDEGWALVDEYPDEDYLVCVDEYRDEMEDFFPKKALVKMIEDKGLIVDRWKNMPAQPDTLSYFVTHEDGRTEEVIEHSPHVYLYELTTKGRSILRSDD